VFSFLLSLERGTYMSPFHVSSHGSLSLQFVMKVMMV